MSEFNDTCYDSCTKFTYTCDITRRNSMVHVTIRVRRSCIHAIILYCTFTTFNYTRHNTCADVTYTCYYTYVNMVNYTNACYSSFPKIPTLVKRGNSNFTSVYLFKLATQCQLHFENV